MIRKKVQGPIRDKEKTKLRILNAVGKILKAKGYQGLQVTKIATVAGVDKKLIYDYYGSVDKLINEYLKQRDYWNSVSELVETTDINDGGKVLAKVLLSGQFDELKKNKELQKIILWELSESKSALKKLADEREAAGEEMFVSITDRHFGSGAKKFRALMAILISSSYYLNLHTDVNGSDFCGLNLKDDEDRNLVKSVISEMIDMFFKEYSE
ncbi:TetR/AcrR family transcriptional regulator [Chryseobacterium taklimakanense]|uniref:TetR/AcrR family transcriptional regulator n=1 Tax=Chryseobacterium taklimakanense TaxID=536441 RepID=UPI001EF5F7A6|nr:TetR/AcrR family transcriptional regulator [Chryseobacterium taklimakanense]MCG7281938.1 TetR/AcrR family transcriptional regulator [Chryseobacterium taklimakanense]